MRRLVFLAVMALGLSSTAFAGKRGETKDWNIDVNMAKLSQYLELSSNQYEEVSKISSFLSDKLQNASSAKDLRKNTKLREAIYGNFKLMKRTLTDEQYKKYVYLVNVTLRNKGMDSYLCDVVEK